MYKFPQINDIYLSILDLFSSINDDFQLPDAFNISSGKQPICPALALRFRFRCQLIRLPWLKLSQSMYSFACHEVLTSDAISTE